MTPVTTDVDGLDETTVLPAELSVFADEAIGIALDAVEVYTEEVSERLGALDTTALELPLAVPGVACAGVETLGLKVWRSLEVVADRLVIDTSTFADVVVDRSAPGESGAITVKELSVTSEPDVSVTMIVGCPMGFGSTVTEADVDTLGKDVVSERPAEVERNVNGADTSLVVEVVVGVARSGSKESPDVSLDTADCD